MTSDGFRSYRMPCTNLALRLRIPADVASTATLSPAHGATGLWLAALRAEWDGRRGLDIERNRVAAANAHEPIAPTKTKTRIAGNLLRNEPKRGMMDAVSRIGRPLRLFTTCGRFVDRLCDSCERVGDNSGACSQVRASPQDIHRFVNSGGLPYAQNNRDLRNSSTLSTSRIEKTGLMK